MDTKIRQTNSYPAYEIDLDLDNIKKAVTVVQSIEATTFAPLNGPMREIGKVISYSIIDSDEGQIHVNEIRNKNEMAFPLGCVFQSTDGRVYFSKAYFDEMNQDD